MNINNNPIVHPQQEAPNVQSLSSSEVSITNCNGSRKELALYPTDSLHISKTLNPFDLGVKPLIHQSELGTYTKSSSFSRKKFLSFCSL
jgi:hypothetical protein